MRAHAHTPLARNSPDQPAAGLIRSLVAQQFTAPAAAAATLTVTLTRTPTFPARPGHYSSHHARNANG
jgi:hypothetical protein